MRQLALQQAPPVFPQDPFPCLTLPPHISAFLFLTVSANSLFPFPQLLLAGHDLRVQASLSHTLSTWLLLFKSLSEELDSNPDGVTNFGFPFPCEQL